jgi:hypothetical protein
MVGRAVAGADVAFVILVLALAWWVLAFHRLADVPAEAPMRR